MLAKCHTCFAETAAFNMRKSSDLGNETSDLIGGDEMYEAICRRCFRDKQEAAGARPIPRPDEKELDCPEVEVDSEADQKTRPSATSKPQATDEIGPPTTSGTPPPQKEEPSATSRAYSPQFRQSSPLYCPPSPTYTPTSPRYGAQGTSCSHALADGAFGYKNLPPGLNRSDSQNNATTSSSMTDEQKARAAANRIKAMETRRDRQARAAAGEKEEAGDNKRKRAINPDKPRKKLAADNGNPVTVTVTNPGNGELVFYSDDDDWDNPVAQGWDDECLYSAIANEVHKLGLEKNPDLPQGQDQDDGKPPLKFAGR